MGGVDQSDKWLIEIDESRKDRDLWRARAVLLEAQSRELIIQLDDLNQRHAQLKAFYGEIITMLPKNWIQNLLSDTSKSLQEEPSGRLTCSGPFMTEMERVTGKRWDGTALGAQELFCDYSGIQMNGLLSGRIQLLPPREYDGGG